MCLYLRSRNNNLSLLFVIANQARCVNKYKNIKHKVLKCNANIYFNKQCWEDDLTPKFSDIKIRNISTATKFTQQVCGMRLKDEIKFLYIEKGKLSEELYHMHFKCANYWGNLWTKYKVNLNSNCEFANTNKKMLSSKTENVQWAKKKNQGLIKMYFFSTIPQMEAKTQNEKVHCSSSKVSLIGERSQLYIVFSESAWTAKNQFWGKSLQFKRRYSREIISSSSS